MKPRRKDPILKFGESTMAVEQFCQSRDGACICGLMGNDIVLCPKPFTPERLKELLDHCRPPRPHLTFCLSSVLNVLRILNSIDEHELVAAGVVTEWNAFRADPFRTFMRMDDERGARLWGIILARVHN